ncbi:glutathione-dependent disulfide-bond oxidoreductase [Halobacteriovorax sp. JY17]|uniref:glutathione-dependent disulfide-bond oxidoreductase n=1 Tax=Halobacteriovorax sp. JY17 TaxID=2014617 RepID=UPI000C496142|nr:glutathione-dependent disulfide-bond oxidoreductase [Halobacteriovorax sp. JY17]PIK13573.1 MAG: glutathione-dependent disulfide-bond oxidoreductase [Halobacteriovorax sp. JY17]
MSQEYIPPKVWKQEANNGGQFANINRPSAGSTHEKSLPKGQHPFQLYSLATPNGVKVTVMFEELLALGIKEAEYNAHLIKITEGDQFSSGFVEINPNSKIPALIDNSEGDSIRVFESGSILLYLAEKFNSFLPKEIEKKTEVLNWLFWQMGSAPYLGGGFGHFYNYAPEKIKYCIDRFTMETKRQLDVLDKNLENRKYIAGDEYTIADIAIWPWYGVLVQGNLYNAEEFIDAKSYKNLLRWAKLIGERPAVRRGVVVNRVWGDEGQQLPERHSEEDFKKIILEKK